MIFDYRQQRLFQLLRGESWNETDARLLYGSHDLNTERELTAGLLAHLGAVQNWAQTPESLIPRLQGVRRQRQVRLRMQLPDARRLFQEWNRAGVRWILIRDAAQQLICGSSYPFSAVRFSVYLEDGDVPEAVSLAEGIGFTLNREAGIHRLRTRLCCVELAERIPGTLPITFSALASADLSCDFYGTQVPVIPPEELLLFRMLETQESFAHLLSPGFLLEKCWETILLYPHVSWDRVIRSAVQMHNRSALLCMSGILSELSSISELQALEQTVRSGPKESREIEECARRQRKLMEKGSLLSAENGRRLNLPYRLRRKLLRTELLYLIRKDRGEG